MCLIDTIASLMKVTTYINEVQRVTESYLSLFNQLLDESGLAEVHMYIHHYAVTLYVIYLSFYLTLVWCKCSCELPPDSYNGDVVERKGSRDW